MKSIPLHSLVLMVGPNSDVKDAIIDRKFQLYEVESVAKIAADIYGDRARLDNADFLLQEVYRRAETKLGLGERVVIDANHLNTKERIIAANIGVKFGASTYYVVTGEDCNTDSKQEAQFRQNKQDILLGDYISNVIDTSIEDFTVVEKLPYKGLLDHIVGHGWFDSGELGYKGLCIVPDVHGMVESLKQAIDWAKSRNLFLVFLGDVLDYGPQSIDCIYLVYDLIMRSQAILTIGNHERKIERWLDQQRKLMHDPHALRGKTPIRMSEGNKATTMIIENMSPKERTKFEGRFAAMIAFARHHWVMGDLLVTHGACAPEMFELDSMRLRGKFESLALFGEIDQKHPTRVDGYPNRIYDWVDRVPLGKTVLVGHDIRSTVKPLYVCGKLGGQIYFMDTGSGKGGRLSTADILFKEGGLEVQNFAAH